MGVRRCLVRSFTNLAPLRTPKSANGPRKNSFRLDSPSHDNLPRGLKTQAQFLSLTPALVPSAADCLHRQAGMPPVAATTSTGSILTH